MVVCCVYRVVAVVYPLGMVLVASRLQMLAVVVVVHGVTGSVATASLNGVVVWLVVLGEWCRHGECGLVVCMVVCREWLVVVLLVLGVRWVVVVGVVVCLVVDGRCCLLLFGMALCQRVLGMSCGV